MIKRSIALTLVAVLWCGQLTHAAPDAITREDQKDVMVTIYNGNLGLVKDTREVRLDAGTLEVQFADVAALIDPTSVHLKSLTDPTALKILEQNYEYDLLTSAKLLEKYVGKKVRLYQSNGAYQEATLLSTNGPIYEINGQIHMGHSGQVVLPALPDNLVSRPTLVWLLRNAKAAAQRVEASYLTGGITWKADYVMVINPTDTRSDLTGWVTIDNKSGGTYSNAALKLVGGDINRAADPRREGRVLEKAAMASPASNASRDFREETFFEYHLYSLDGRTTIKDNQTKQLSLMSAADVPVDKHFIYYGAADYYRTSYGLPVSNQKVGDAFDVVGERVQKDWKRIASNLYEVEWEISLRNHKKENITVEVFEPMPGDWEVLGASQPHEKVQAFTAKWNVAVPTEGEAKLSYRIRVRF